MEWSGVDWAWKLGGSFFCHFFQIAWKFSEIEIKIFSKYFIMLRK
jgi:hypothetical protein